MTEESLNKLANLIKNIDVMYEKKEITTGEYIQIMLLVRLVTMVENAIG